MSQKYLTYTLVNVLKRNSVEISLPKQKCCGMPALDGGEIDKARENALFNINSFIEWVRNGYEIA